MIYDFMQHQEEFFTSKKVHSGLIGGYGCGKTFIGVLKTVQKKLEYPKIDVAYYLPTYSLIHDIAFPNFSNILEAHKIDFDLNKSHKEFVTNYGRIILRSMDVPESIIGYETGYSLIDEADVIPKAKMKDAFKNIVARNRKQLPNGDVNSTDFVSTPEGFGFLYDFFVKDLTPNKLLIKGNSLDNPHLSKTYIETLKESYSESQLKAYLFGEFVNLNNETVFYNYDINRNNTTRTIKASDKLYVGMDFNIGNMSAVIHVVDGKKVSAVDEVSKVFDTAQMCAVLKQRFPNFKITIYPDASGANRSTTGRSDFDLLRGEGFTIVSGKSNPLVKDRITTANAEFLNGKGETNYFVNLLECPNYSESLTKLAYKNGIPDKTSGFDHMTDAGTYALYKIVKSQRDYDNVNL